MTDPTDTDAHAEIRRLRAIIDSGVDVAIMPTDRMGRITDWNAGAAAVFGWTAADMIGETLARIFTPEDRAADRLGEEMALALRDGRADDERWHLRSDGTRFWASGGLTPLRDGDGAHRGYVKMVRDRTAEHRTAADLRETQAMLGRAQDAGGVGVFSVGRDGLIRTTPAFCDLFGVACCDDVPSTLFERLVIPEDAALVSTMQTRNDGSAPLDVEYRIRRADTGEVRWMARRGRIERDPDGESTRFSGVVRDITDQVVARQALARERETMAQMFEQAPTFMAILRGPEHRFERANPGYFKLIGHRDVVGRTVADVLPDAMDQGFGDLLDRVYRTGEPFAADGYLYRVQAVRDGPVDERYVNFVYQPLRDADGAVSGIFVEGADVTDRTLAAAALRSNEERYRAVMGSIDVGFCIIALKFDDDGRAIDYRLVEGNAAFERQTGLTDAWGRWVSEVAPGLERHWFDTYGRVALTGEPARFENRAEVFRRWYDVRALRVGDPADHHVAVLFNDISDRRRMEEALRTLNAELATEVARRTADRDRLWTLSAEIMLVAGFDGVIQAVNPAWLRVLGWHERELLGTSLFDLIHPDDRAATVAGAQAIADGQTFGRFENRYRHRDGSYRDIAWSAGPADAVIVAVGRDETGERQQRIALAEAEDRLRQSQKMEAVGQLTGGLAHDFNNLLTAVTGGLELLGHRVAAGRYDQLGRYIDMAQTGAQRAAALTQRLLAFSRRQTLAPTPTDVDRLVAAMTEIIDRTLGPTIDVAVATTPGLWPVLVDAPQLDNALLNLCINARDAMPDGGRLTIASGNRTFDAHAAAEHDLAAGDYVALCVTDTGTGMPPDVIARVFDPFFTTKPIGEGTGLGLSMIYGFVRQSGGQIRIDSRVGAGTTMCLFFPRHLGDAAALPDDSAGPAGPRAQVGETILLVEDEAAIRTLMREVLEDAGYRVLEARNGPIGVQLLQSTERIDLLVTDVGLPGGLNGRQVADAGRAVRPALKVLFITGYAANAAVGAGHMDEGMGLLTKPFNVLDLERRVRAMID